MESLSESRGPRTPRRVYARRARSRSGRRAGAETAGTSLGGRTGARNGSSPVGEKMRGSREPKSALSEDGGFAGSRTDFAATGAGPMSAVVSAGGCSTSESEGGAASVEGAETNEANRKHQKVDLVVAT